MLKIGIDNVNLERLTDSMIENLEKILTENEKKEYEVCKNKKEFIASHFACKEAFIKAMNDKTIGFRKIELLHNIDGSPHLYYLGKEIGQVSITHDLVCTAVVILDI